MARDNDAIGNALLSFEEDLLNLIAKHSNKIAKAHGPNPDMSEVLASIGIALFTAHRAVTHQQLGDKYCEMAAAIYSNKVLQVAFAAMDMTATEQFEAREQAKTATKQ